MANAIDLLKKDHETVEEMFGKLEAEKDTSSKQAKELVERISVEIQAHAQLEEELFYPALQDTDEKSVSLVGEAIEEHHSVEGLLDQISQAKAGSEEYQAMLTTLMASVRHHVEEEEKEVFPLANKVLGKRLDEIGKEMESRRKEVRKAA